MEIEQIPLKLGLRDSATFENFLMGANGAAVHALCELDERVVCLWGGPGVGKTHLLQALCHEASATGLTAAYLPLNELVTLSAEMLEGLEQLDLVCVDDVQQIAGRADWEAGLFHLFNRIRDSHGRLIVACNAAPPALGLHLPDLASRLAWGPVFQLQPLTDEGKVQALRLRARARGLELPEEVGTYLLRRCPRDMHALFPVLELLDHASLAAQRKLTIPFVRSVLGGS